MTDSNLLQAEKAPDGSVTISRYVYLLIHETPTNVDTIDVFANEEAVLDALSHCDEEGECHVIREQVL